MMTHIDICKFKGDVCKKHETIVEGRKSFVNFGFRWRKTNRTIRWLVPSAVSLWRAGVEQLYQVKRMFGGIGNMLFSIYSPTSHLLYCCFHCVLRSGDCLLFHGSGEVFAHNCFPFPQLFDHGHSGRSRGFRHSGGRAATHQVLGSYGIFEQRIGRHSHSTTAAASGGRHACGTAGPISTRTAMPRSTQRCHEVARRGEGGHHARASATGCHSRCAALVATWNAIVATDGLHSATATAAQTRHVC